MEEIENTQLLDEELPEIAKEIKAIIDKYDMKDSCTDCCAVIGCEGDLIYCQGAGKTLNLIKSMTCTISEKDQMLQIVSHALIDHIKSQDTPVIYLLRYVNDLMRNISDDDTVAKVFEKLMTAFAKTYIDEEGINLNLN